MKLRAYCIKDDLTGYQIPQFEINEQTALRNFSYAVNETKGLLQSYAKDYSLYFVGVFDTESGCLTSCDPEKIIEASSIRRNGDE